MKSNRNRHKESGIGEVRTKELQDTEGKKVCRLYNAVNYSRITRRTAEGVMLINQYGKQVWANGGTATEQAINRLADLEDAVESSDLLKYNDPVKGRKMNNANILGTEYRIFKRKYKEDPLFKERGVEGYCDMVLKRIVYLDRRTLPGWKERNKRERKIAEKEVLRHEIVHAFLRESGLNDCSTSTEAPWARNEEMIDWFALQGEKIYRAWSEAGAL